MIFSELYSAYYTAVAKILTEASKPGLTERQLQELVREHAFTESAMTILPALKSGRWPFLDKQLRSVLHHTPTMPLTLLQKRWLKAILEDPRIRLFDVTIPGLEEIEPLFTSQDYRIYDQYADGDSFENERYIRHFRLLREAIETKRPVKISMVNRKGEPVWVRFYPEGFEYSLKDNKFRILASGCRYHYFNLGRILTCQYYEGKGPWRETPKEDPLQELTLKLVDKRNALERVMLHFAHFEKRAERLDADHYLLHLKYYQSDEAEMVIRILSFGPYVKVLEPQHFVDCIKERLIAQKSCKL